MLPSMPLFMLAALGVRIRGNPEDVAAYWQVSLRPGQRKYADIWLLKHRRHLAERPMPQRARFVALIDELFHDPKRR